MTDFIIKWFADPIVQKIFIALIGFIVINVAVRLLKIYLGRQIDDTRNRYRIRKLISFIGYLIVLLLILTTFRAHLKDVHIALGIAGAGIAFSLQEVIASLAGWIAISFGNFYKTGDRVQLGGIKGDVIDIAMLRTTLMETGDWIGGDQYNGRIVRIANSFVFREPVFNYSTDFPFLWDEITVPVKHGSDFRLAKDIFQRVLNEITGDFANHAENAWKEMVSKYLIEAESVQPSIIMIINDNWLQFTLRYVVDFRKRRFTKDKIFTRILEELEETDGRVAIASTTIQLTAVPSFDVRIAKETK